MKNKQNSLFSVKSINAPIHLLLTAACSDYLFYVTHILTELYLPEQCYKDDSDNDSVDGDRHSLITYVPPTEEDSRENPGTGSTSINSNEPRQSVSCSRLLNYIYINFVAYIYFLIASVVSNKLTKVIF